MLNRLACSTFASVKKQIRIRVKDHQPFLVNKKNPSEKGKKDELKNQDRSREDKSEENDDIHSLRLSQSMKVDIGNEQSTNFKFKPQFKDSMKQLKMDDLNIVSIESEDNVNQIPRLQHNLDFIANKPAIYPLSSIQQLLPNNLDKEFLENIYPQNKLKMERFDIYVPPSHDETLLKIAQASNLKYIMSTSTFSQMLAQLFYVVSGFKGPYFQDVFDKFPDEPKKFMITQRKPVSNFLHIVDKERGIYALDADPGLFQPPNSILINIGKITERQLTLTREEFMQRYVDDKPPKDQKPIEDYHRFMSLNNEICLRSQIDCYSIAPDGKPFVFEIKSRSACPFRYDFPNYFEYLGYEITQLEGLCSSYEREYYDLIRGAFLKWSFQLKIGRMEGAFVAYHNVEKIQGFEYIPTKEINKRIFGTEYYAETLFTVTARLGTTMLKEITKALKSEEYESIKLGLYASSHQRKLIIFTELYKSREEIDNFAPLLQSKVLNDEYDFYTNYKPLKNKVNPFEIQSIKQVLKFEMHIRIEVNGIEQIAASKPFREGDLINIHYSLQEHGEAEFKDYMNFLHDCYKHEQINLDLTYAGAWLKVQ